MKVPQNRGVPSVALGDRRGQPEQGSGPPRRVALNAMRNGSVGAYGHFNPHGGVRLFPGTDDRFDRLIVSQRPVPKRALNLGSQNSPNPSSAMDLLEILWDFHVVCLNAPST